MTKTRETYPLDSIEVKKGKEELEQLQLVILSEKTKQAEDGTLVTNWINWYKRRKVVTRKNSTEYLNTMIQGIANDFYMVLQSKNRTIKELEGVIKHLKERDENNKKDIKENS